MGLFGNYMKTINEDIPQPAKLQEVDIVHAVDKGLSAFWQEIAKSFPNMKTKDLAPDMAKKFRDTATEATNSWLQGKKPGEVGTQIKKESVPAFNSFNRNPFAVQTTQWNTYNP